MFIELESDYIPSRKQLINIHNIVAVREIDEAASWITTKATTTGEGQLRVKGSYEEIKNKIKEVIDRKD